MRIINEAVSQQNNLIDGLKVLVDHSSFEAAKSMLASLLGNAFIQGRVGEGAWGQVTNSSTSIRISTDGGVTYSQPFGVLNGANIVALLTALVGENRLSINALKDLDSLEFPTEFDFIQFVTDAVNTFNAGKLYWNSLKQTLSIDTEYLNTSVDLSTTYTIGRNTGGTIPKGRVVYMNTPVDGLHTITLASSDNIATCGNVYVAMMDIPTGTSGIIAKFGILDGINTSGFTVNDTLYLSTLGNVTNIQPEFPNYIIKIGTVLTSNASLGRILVDVGLDYSSDVLKRVEEEGDGNAVTSLEVDGDTIIAKKDLTFLLPEDIEGKVDKEEGKRLVTEEEAELLQNLKQVVYTINLPSAATVANRCSGAIEGTDYPEGWIIEADTNPIDFKVTHNLGRRVASVTITYSTGSVHRQLFGNAAYSGMFTPDMNSLVIESLATITSPIQVYIVFV